MSASVDFTFESEALLLSAYDANVRSSMHWVHTSWLCGALDLDMSSADSLRRALLQKDERSVARCSIALIRMLTDKVPRWVHSLETSVAWLDVVPIEIGVQMLRLRSIIFRRSELRRVIDKPSRVRLAQWGGVPLDGALDSCNGAPDIARMVAENLVLPQEQMDAVAIAEEGYRLLVCDAPELAAFCPLLRLALPQEGSAAWRADAFSCGQDKGGMEVLRSYFPVWFPEWAWLFG